ncbi:MAG: hypothetical protein NPIRA06_06570 [Nitrospirales bacterium]|nr:MAG: hypothetical protein NPIRA06_06570 [Nitrospirales bacterium]
MGRVAVDTEFAFGGHCEQWVAKVVSIEETIEVRSADAPTWETRAIDDTFCPGYTVRVPQWWAVLVLKNETIVRLDAGSEITFTEVKEGRPSWIDLLKGMAHFLSRTPQRLTIATPCVNGTIEGTEFFIRIHEHESQFWVFEGRVLLANELGTLSVLGSL